MPASGSGQGAGKHFYVAPSAERGGDGSSERPWDLATALAHPWVVKPGDTIWLRGGTYRGDYTSSLTGVEGAPIILRQYSGERAIIDGSGSAAGATLRIEGAWAMYWGLEVTNSDPANRISTKEGPFPSDLVRDTGVVIAGAHIKVINCVVHDTRMAFEFFSVATDSEIYGSLIYYNGWLGPDRAWGPGIYTQNEVGTKRIVDNIVFNQFNHGLQIYGSNEASVVDFHIEGNTIFNNGYIGPSRAMNLLLGSGRPSERIALLNNCMYTPDGAGTNIFLGYSVEVFHKDLSVQGNYLVGGGPVMSISKWREVLLSGNTFFGSVGPVIDVVTSGGRLLGSKPPAARGRTPGAAAPAGAGEPPLQTESIPGHRWEGNSYYFLGQGGAGPFRYRSPNLNFSGDLNLWRQVTGLDQNSRYATSRPTGQAVFVRPNQYEPGRAHVTIYNWELSDSAEVVVSGLKLGQRFEVRDAQNYFGRPVVSGTYDGKFVTIPLAGQTQTSALAGVGHPGNEILKQPQHTDKEFQVFVVVPY